MSGILFRLLLAAIVLLLFYIRYRIKRKKFYDAASKMPGPRSYPFIGDILTFASNTHHAINIGMKYVRRFKGKPIRFWFLNDLIIFLTNPSDVEIVLSNMKQFKKPWQYKVLNPFMGKGLFTNDDVTKWRLHRKIITPAFHFNILKGFIPIFFEETSIFVKKVIPGEEMDVFTMTGLLTLDIICRTAMGVEVHSQSGKGKDFVHGMETLLSIAQNRLTRPWMMSDTIFSWSSLKKEHDKACDSVLKFTENIIKEKKARQNNNTHTSGTENKDAGTFLDLMLNGDNENDMTDDQLRDETITIMIGGQETTTTEITFTLLMLALHQEVQQQVLEEIDTVFQGDKTRMTSFEDLQQLEYLERVIKEVMRLYPSIPLFARVTDEDMDLNGYHLPKGCITAIFIYATHRDPKSFPNPEKFDPDNFLPERCRGRSPFAYLPFSAGPRNCIGQKYGMLQLKTLLSTILRHYKVFPGGNMKCFEDVEVTMSTTIRSRRPVKLVFTIR